MAQYDFCTKIPEPFDRETQQNLAKMASDGDIKAKEELITHNIKLVVYVVRKYFKNTNYELDDLVSTGFIGLIKSVDLYKETGGACFTTYATKCIYNEIGMLLRKGRHHLNCVSLDAEMYNDKTDSDYNLNDYLVDDSYGFIEKIEDDDFVNKAKKRISMMSLCNQEVANMHFGLKDGNFYKQKEISKKTNITQSCISRKIKKISKDMKDALEDN